MTTFDAAKYRQTTRDPWDAAAEAIPAGHHHVAMPRDQREWTMTTKTRRAAAILSATFAILGATACSKNEAATSACSAMQTTDTCSACCSTNGASGHKIATGSTCTCLGGSGAAKAPPAPNAKATAATASFAGTYKSNWGPTTFAQNGSAIAATYARGSMSCQPSSNTLDCDWKEGALSGKAKLTKEADGSLKGTWGNGASNSNGGTWLFTP